MNLFIHGQHGFQQSLGVYGNNIITNRFVGSYYRACYDCIWFYMLREAMLIPALLLI